MATACPIDLDVRHLAAEIERIYARVAEDPAGDFHFHRGPEYAASMLGYDATELAQLPAATTAAFAGVSNPLAIAPLKAGEVVVDVGSGAGTDLLLAAARVGPTGRAIGVDPTGPMRDRAQASARALGHDHVEIVEGDAQRIPLPDGTVDVVISNGVINLATDKLAAFGEIHRILRPGGRLQLGDIVVASELSVAVRSDVDLWTG